MRITESEREQWGLERSCFLISVCSCFCSAERKGTKEGKCEGGLWIVKKQRQNNQGSEKMMNAKRNLPFIIYCEVCDSSSSSLELRNLYGVWAVF